MLSPLNSRVVLAYVRFGTAQNENMKKEQNGFCCVNDFEYLFETSYGVFSGLLAFKWFSS